MNLRKISFGNFKCLYNIAFEPGKVNVFIGTNGSGKSTILEAIGLLSAAMTDRVDSASLQRKGGRLYQWQTGRCSHAVMKNSRLFKPSHII